MNQEFFLQQLEDAGVNTQEAIARFMGNTALFLKFIQRLPEVLKFAEIRQAIQTEDSETFYMLVHTLKGTAGNLGVGAVFDCAHAMLTEYRTTGFSHTRKLLGLVQEAENESAKLSRLLLSFQKDCGGTQE